MTKACLLRAASAVASIIAPHGEAWLPIEAQPSFPWLHVVTLQRVDAANERIVVPNSAAGVTAR